MEKRKLRRTNPFVPVDSDFEHPSGESMTVPDEAMSIRDIMERHVRGMRVAETLYREGKFSEDPDFDDPDLEKVATMDMVDRQAVAAANQEKIDAMKKDIADKQAEAKKKAEAKAKIDRAVDDDDSDPVESGAGDDKRRRSAKEPSVKARSGSESQRQQTDPGAD